MRRGGAGDAPGGAAPAEQRRANVTQTALLRIQEMLRSGELAAGAPLPAQRQLARDLQISRASLREAMSILGTLGVVRIEQGRGTFVAAGGENEAHRAAPSPNSWRYAARYSLEEVYQFRLIAEPSAAALAARLVSAAQLDELGRNLRVFRAATRQGDFVASSQADFDFHELVMRFSGNRMLADLQQTYHHVVLESQRLPLMRRGRVFEPVVEHERILQALTMRDPEGSAYYMRAHIHRAADRVGLRITDPG